MDTRHFTSAGRLWRSALVAVFVGCGLTQLSCYPGDELNATDTDIIATFHSPDFDFATVTTYAMADSVAHSNGADNDHQVGPYDAQILTRVAAGLDAMGFTRVPDPNAADVLVTNFSTQTQWVAGGCYDYWYWGWWYPYYGYCYPTYYTYETGTVVTLMFKRPATPPTPGSPKPSPIWTSAINGLTTGQSSASITQRINTSVDQAFAQSPYLGDGK
jgi:uncharacterized protein DUF4136